MEEWRKVPGYENYEISIETKEGKCRSLNYNKTGEAKELSCKADKNGRLYWGLVKNCVQTREQAARWIALTYPELVENEYFEGAEIDHKDTDPLNNHPSNLRWVTPKENMNNPLTIKKFQARCGDKHWNYEKTVPQGVRDKISETLKGVFLNRKDISKPVAQFAKNGEMIAVYPSIAEAERQTGVLKQNISHCCIGKRKTSGGFIWKYK